MYSDFKEQAIEYVKQAVQEDNARNHAKAFPLYMNALEYFKTHLKYEKNPKIREEGSSEKMNIEDDDSLTWVRWRATGLGAWECFSSEFRGLGFTGLGTRRQWRSTGAEDQARTVALTT
ncbi:hypothetical protein AHAS_Ahas12G0130900 [Arachis hypogaea]